MKMPRQIPFAWKIISIVVLMIALSGIAVTSVAVHQFRRELYAREFSAAYTVYMSAVNYLIAHYKGHRGQFERRSLDYVLERRFLQLSGEKGERITYRPTALVVYNERGILAYEYSATRQYVAPRYIPPQERPVDYREKYDRSSKSLFVAGPISPSGEVPGYVFITLPSEIEAKTAALFRGIFMAIGLVIAGAIGLCSLLATRALAPVQRLIVAAKRVRSGDLQERVRVTTKDEIGMLGETFNDMVAALSRRLDLMHRLQNWTMRLSRVTDEQTLFDTFMEMCEELAPAQAFRLYVYDSEADRLRVAAQYERAANPSEDRERLTTRAFHENAPRYVTATGEEILTAQNVAEMAIPLIVGEEALGCIWVGKPLRGECYDEETVTILHTMAQHAAAAMENVRLFAERAEKQRYEREMALAREIQMGMLPDKVPQVPGYELFAVCRPAFEVGGDYYDYIPIPGHGWCFVTGDVSGKGVPAAMIVSMVRTLLHTCVQFEASIEQVLRWINRNVTPDLRGDMFVTMNVLSLTDVQAPVTLFRAGHEPALRLRPGNDVEMLAPQGSALGLLEVKTFDQMLQPLTVEMKPNDTLLFYTDGVTEALNEQDEEFGLQRLVEAARKMAGTSARKTVESLLRDLNEFIGHRPQADDITLMAIRRLP